MSYQRDREEFAYRMTKEGMPLGDRLWLERSGHALRDTGHLDLIAIREVTDKQERDRAEAVDDLLYALEEVEAADFVHAFRAYSVAMQSFGRIGFWPTGLFSDAAIAVKNAIESVLVRA